MQQVTVRVELGPHVLLGREVEFVEVTQAVGDHARCVLAFDRDPRSASPLARVALAELADASVRVVFLDAAGPNGAAGEGGTLAFAGRVREATAAHQPSGGARITVYAASDSHVLAAHVDRRYLRKHTVAQAAAALGAAAVGELPEGDTRDYVQRGESAWAFLARLAAGEGLQLRPRWPRTADAASDAEAAELGRGFAEVTHALTWGRDLLGLETVLRPVNPGVTGAFYDPAAKHDHRFRGVRQKAAWLGGARPAIEAAERVGTADAGGGDPGHVEGGAAGGLGGARARTQEEFRARLERASAARAGSAVQASGTSVQPALRAGDRVRVQDGTPAAGEGGGGAASTWAGPEADERSGTYGLTRVVHTWQGGHYENFFDATPWAAYHPTPAAAEAQLAAAPEEDAAAAGHAPAGFALAVVVANDDPERRARVQVRYAWMAEGEATGWVRVVGLGGGNTRGLGVLPSVGDEVVVAAVAGDPEHPVVVGALWNGMDTAGHAPGRQHWVTPAGSALALLEGTGDRGGAAETVELHTPQAKTWVQLTQRGPTGVPLVTVHSEGDLALEAPNGQLRLTAQRYLAHVAEAHATNAGPVTIKSSGAVTVESGAALGLKAAGEVAVRAGGALRAHAAGSHTLSGARVAANPPGATAPSVVARVAALPGSAWGPRPVPLPGPGRSTEDPRTPTRKDLAARAAAAPTWLELEYVHPDDGAPMAGAPYRVRFADGAVRTGALDARGRARLDGLSPALAGTAVEVTFGEVPDEYRALPGDAAPNPDYRGSETAFDDALLERRPLLASAGGAESLAVLGLSFAPSIPDAVGDVLDWIWGVLQGDFAENPSTSQIVAGAVLTMIPGIDQAADVRDVIANLARLRDPAERGNPLSPAYLMLATTAVGVVPVLGSPIKGALRLVMRNAEATRGALFAVLRRLGRGDPAAFVERHLSAGAIEDYARRGLGLVQERIAAVLAGMERVGRRLGVGRLVAAAADARRELGEIVAAAERGLRQAAQALADRVSRAVRHGESDAAAAGATGGRVRREADAADPPGGGGGGEEGGGPRPRRSFSPAQREMVDEMRRNGVKFDEAKLLDVRRTPDGRVVFLEEGNDRAGLRHIMRHSGEFSDVGIPPDRVPQTVMDALEHGRVVGQQTPTRQVYEVTVDGRRRFIAITTSNNGFVVGANPRTGP